MEYLSTVSLGHDYDLSERLEYYNFRHECAVSFVWHEITYVEAQSFSDYHLWTCVNLGHDAGVHFTIPYSALLAFETWAGDDVPETDELELSRYDITPVNSSSDAPTYASSFSPVSPDSPRLPPNPEVDLSTHMAAPPRTDTPAPLPFPEFSTPTPLILRPAKRARDSPYPAYARPVRRQITPQSDPRRLELSNLTPIVQVVTPPTPPRERVVIDLTNLPDSPIPRPIRRLRLGPLEPLENVSSIKGEDEESESEEEFEESDEDTRSVESSDMGSLEDFVDDEDASDSDSDESYYPDAQEEHFVLEEGTI